MKFSLSAVMLLTLSISGFSDVITTSAGSKQTIQVRVDNWKWIEKEDDGEVFMQQINRSGGA